MSLGELEIKRLLHQLEHGSAVERADAAESLGQARDLQAVGGLIQALSDPAPEVAWAASTALPLLGSPAAAHILDALPRLQGAALARLTEALGTLKEPLAAPHLVRLLASGDWSVRSAAARALGKLGKQVVPLLEGPLQNGAPETVMAAATALGHIGDASAIGLLSGCLDDEAFPEVQSRIAAVQAIGHIGSATGVDALIMALESDRAREVKRAAQEAIDGLIVRDAQGWQQALGPIMNPERRVWWFRWAHRQHVPWLEPAIQKALADEAYIQSLNVWRRWRYRSALEELLTDSFGIQPPSLRWDWPPALLPDEPTRIPVLARYGQIAEPGLVERLMSRDDPPEEGFVHKTIGYLEITPLQATLFLGGQAAWQLDLERPIHHHVHFDPTDAEFTDPAIVSVHIVLRQAHQDNGRWTRAGLSFHVCDTHQVRALPQLRQTFPYVSDQDAQDVLAWIAAWTGGRAQ